MNSNLVKVLAALAILSLSVLSCEGNKEEDANDKIITTYISVPSNIEVEEGSTITLVLASITNIKETDEVLLRSASNQDYVCPIVSYKDASKLEFALADGILNGTYKIYIRRNSLT